MPRWAVLENGAALRWRVTIGARTARSAYRYWRRWHRQAYEALARATRADGAAAGNMRALARRGAAADGVQNPLRENVNGMAALSRSGAA